MKIIDVVDIVEKFGGKLITGKSSLDSDVLTVEVMEVPEVETWAREGLLLITTFYAVKDDLDQQYRIVEKLIQRNAAGIIVKVGRFISRLSIDIIELAKTNQFPIIILPKNVPYIDILIPLNKRLHSEETSQEKKNRLLQIYANKPFHSINDAINYLAYHFECTIYIEDYKGRLLYITDKFYSDGWRNSKYLFSHPVYSEYSKLLKNWIKKSRIKEHYIKKNILGIKDRIIIPLNFRKRNFIFTHLVFNTKNQFRNLSKEDIYIIQNKIYTVLAEELIELQQEEIRQREEIFKLKRKKYSKKQSLPHVLLFISRQKNDFIYKGHDHTIDYLSIFRGNIKKLIGEVQNVTKSLIFESKSKTYVLLTLNELKTFDYNFFQSELLESLDSTMISDSYISFCLPFYNLNMLDEKIKVVNNILDIGRKLYGDDKIFSQNKLGIYEFLIQLSVNKRVQQYVNDILNPLISDHPELLETLVVYLKENGNATRTAESLYISRRTVTNHLKKIKELLNIDLENGETIFTLHFCIKMLQLK